MTVINAVEHRNFNPTERVQTPGKWLAVAIFLSFAASSCAGRTTRPESEPMPVAKNATASSPDENTNTTTKTAATQTQNRDAASDEASAEYHFSMAQAYVAEGNPDRAIEEYKLVLMYDPKSALVHARLAGEYIKKGQLSAALENCKEAVRLDPSYVDARLMLAGLYSGAHETKQALAEYERILKSNPKHEEAAVYRAQVLMEDGRPEDALKGLRGFVKANPDSPVAFYYLGRAEQTQNHYAEAVSAFKKALEARPGFTQAALALGFLYEEKGKNSLAIATYKDLYETSQDMAAANRLATIYLKEEKYTLALPYLEAMELSDPDDMNVRVKLGLVRMELKNYDAAIATFKTILERNPESDRIHYYLGSIYEELKKNDEAIAHLKQIRPNSKLYTDAVLHVGHLLKSTNQLSAARKVVEEGINKSPETSGFYLFKATLDEDSKDLKTAIATLEIAVDKFPRDERVRYYLGSLYDRVGQVDRGLEQMEEILKINPENVDALNYIGYTWTTKGVRLNDAEKLLRRAVGLKPDNGYIQDSWGWYLYVRGRVDEAVVELEKAARLKPSEATILEHLADAYLKSNLREKALNQYKDALKHAEDEEARRKIQNKLESLVREIAGEPGTTGVTGDRVPAGKPSPTR